MFGLILALVYGAGVYFLGKPNTFPEVFLGTTNFLLWWYIITSIILGVIMALVSIGIAGAGTILGASKMGALGGVLGFFGGGALSVLIMVLFAVKVTCSVGGVYLLHNSLTGASTGTPEWDTAKLIFGGILLMLSLVMGASSRSSSKH